MANTQFANSLVMDLRDIHKTQLNIVGGKAANLGELFRIEGITIPDGFCISTAAFKRMMTETPYLIELVDQLSHLKLEERNKIAELSDRIRQIIEATTMPRAISQDITSLLSKHDEQNAYAIRSSATAEDLPNASFAGLQDTHLNIIRKEAILKHIIKCWASLFTERAVIYRIQNGFDHRKTHLSVIVQQMVFSQVAGILFTADPVTGNRKVLSIDAGFGLGEAMVSGLVNADLYKVSNGKVIYKKISGKVQGIYPLKEGGTKVQRIEPRQQKKQALSDDHILQLERIARKIEARFGSPQDIEWCWADGQFYIVQSRPITTLYPIPERAIRSGQCEADEQQNHVYLSVGHQQMMTDPIKPLGLSFFLLTTNAPMRTAGGRLFVDVTNHLSSTANSKRVIKTLGQHDPLIRDALMSIVKRKGFIKNASEEKKLPVHLSGNKEMTWSYLSTFEKNPGIVTDLVNNSHASIETLKQDIDTKSGVPLFDFILEDIQQLKKILFHPQSSQVIRVAMFASTWINKKMEKWLGEKKAADTVSLSVPNNITSEMGLKLLDVADVIRPYPKIINYLQHVRDENFLDELVKFNGGRETVAALSAYLNEYGMRCAGEIDITKTRWLEKPTVLLPMLLNNIKNFETNAGTRKFEQGQQEALKKEQTLVERLRQLPNGAQKVRQTKIMISLVRNFIGYREYPKYDMINRYFVYKQALMKEAERLVQSQILPEIEDIFYLSFEEFREAVSTHKLDYQVISERKDAYKIYERVNPPRVITSDGEIITGTYKRKKLPAGAIAGLPVSAGLIEGRARVILNMENADLEEGDILVTAFTDPSWTPLFVSIKGLVTEVGGLMTHGAVIAREYGLAAVVGVEHATKLIKDGQRIRVNGTDGYVEIL